MTRLLLKLGALVCALAFVVGAIAGCTAFPTPLDSAQQARQAFMSQVNGVMGELGDDLDSFVEAVSRNDVVNMRTQAENAYGALDDLGALEAPDELSDVKQGYVDGAAKLREALDAYITLYTEVDAGTLDRSTYGVRLAEVQSLYDEGVKLLQQADESAAAKTQG